jgi:hypothetical protein
LAIRRKKQQIKKAHRENIKDELVIIHAPPPPDYATHLNNVLFHTIQRRQGIVRGRLVPDGSHFHSQQGAERMRYRMARVKHMVNGPIWLPCAIHYENNCCNDENGQFSRDICVDKYATACEDGGLLGDELSDVPSKNRWGSVSEHEAEQALGDLVHKFHARALARAFANWNASDIDLEDEPDDYRRMVKGKVYRSRMCTSSEEHQWQKACRVWGMGPMDHLWMRLQHMDEEGNSVFDINMPRTNPIQHQRESTATAISQPVMTGPMATLFKHYSESSLPETLDKMVSYIRKMLVSQDAQVWYWLSILTEFPLRWVAAFDVRRSDQEQADIMEEGWRQPLCCKHPNFDRKIPNVYTTLSQLRRCPCFKSSCIGMGSRGRVTNMGLERLLGLIKKASPARLPYAERLLAAGLLTQWLKPHLAAGGEDPRTVTRAQMIRDGVPIEANRTSSLRGGLRASHCYANDELAKVKLARKQAGEEPLDRTASNDLKRNFNQAFPKLPADTIQHYKDLAGEKAEGRRAEVANAGDRPYESARRWGLCSNEEPVRIDAINEIVCSYADSGSVGGISAPMDKLRKEFANFSVFFDRGDIPKSEKVKYYTTCRQKHRGLCRWDDAQNFNLALDIGTRVNALLLDTNAFLDGDWFSISMQCDDVRDVVYGYLAHQRFRDPKIALVNI